MSFFKYIPAGKNTKAGFAVKLEDDSLSPCLHAGQTAYIQRTADLCDGDVGLFLTRKGLVFRQYCRDSRGTVFLFSLDRTGKKDDLEFPRSAELPVCYGKVMLRHNPELPLD